jgi:hypothetical protein
MIIELEVELNLPSGLGNIIPPHAGIYSPAPAFWSASAASNVIDPPISSAIFTLNPDGSTTITSVLPEPSAFLLAGAGLLLVGLLGKRRLTAASQPNKE